MTRVGLVSDTHDNAPLCERAAAFLRAQAPDLVLHLGDVTRPATARLFAGLPARFLLGNNDVDPGLADALASCGFPPLAASWTAQVDGLRVGATHGHLAARVRQLRASCDVLLHGHTHRRRAEREEGALVVNPGALFRAPVRTIATLDLPERAVAFYEVREDGVRPVA